MGRIVGIDLGTTNSVVATVDMGGARVIQNKQNEHETRSIVTHYKGEFLVGTPALRRWLLNPKETIISIKRLMGRGVGDPEVKKIQEKKVTKNWIQYDIVQPTTGTKDSLRVKLADKEYSPVQISAEILKKLKEDAEFVLGEDVSHAVITVPAYFSDKQRSATREAGLMAGFTVMKILDEPTAAAIAFGIDSRDQEARSILVFDLGGGTFDISVLMMAAGAFSPLNLEGDMWLGGDDFDELIVDHMLNFIQASYGLNPRNDDRFMATLKHEAQRAKETLSSARTAEIIIPGMLRDASGNIVDVESEISREQFETMMDPLIKRVEALVRRAVENANFEFGDIDYVLMAGNSTSIPRVQHLMEGMFGNEKVLRKIHPKHSVAIGAAMAAAVYGAVNCPKCSHNNPLDAAQCEKCGAPLAGLVETKNCPGCGAENRLDADTCAGCGGPFIQVSGIRGGIAPFHYGVQTEGDKFNIFIRKGDPFETPEGSRIVQTFYTRFPNQRVICVPVFGGDDDSKASNNIKQGEAFSVLPPNFPQGTPIKVKMWLDRDGAFIVDNFLEDGTDLEDLILRGERDQRAVEILVEAEEKLAVKKDSIPPDQRQRIEEKRNDVLDRMNQKDFSGAYDQAQVLLKEIDGAGPGQLGLGEQAENMVNYVRYIINEYNWIIGPHAYTLNTMATELEQAVAVKNTPLIQTRFNQLNLKLAELLKSSDLGAFLSLHGAIITVIQPVDPAQANELRGELKTIEQAFKNKSPDANSRLTQYLQKFNQAIQAAQQKKPEGRPCPNCGTQNPMGSRHCQSCRTDLWILGAR